MAETRTEIAGPMCGWTSENEPQRRADWHGHLLPPLQFGYGSEEEVNIL